MTQCARNLLATLFILVSVNALLSANATAAEAAVPMTRSQRAFALAGLVLNYGEQLRPEEVTVNIRVVTEVIPDEHAGKSYDVIFLALPSSLEAGYIVTLTSGSTASCRPALKKLIDDSLKPDTVHRAYPGAQLTRVEDNAAVAKLAAQWRSHGWLRNCAEASGGNYDSIEVLILNGAA
jgi:hypothetical protein